MSPERIAALQYRWDEAVHEVVEATCGPIPADTDAGSWLAFSTQSQLVIDQDLPHLIGIAGPGAVGKSTLMRFMADKLGFNRIINTTTRQPRSGEVDSKDYFFTSPETFEAKRKLGSFAMHLERPGRGWYGIDSEEILAKLKDASVGSIFEENPANILDVLETMQEGRFNKVLLYVLPPSPIMQRSVEHLLDRLSREQDPSKRHLTEDIFESTLGDRQIDEFLQLHGLPQAPATQLVVIVNDTLDDAYENLTDIFGQTNERHDRPAT